MGKTDAKSPTKPQKPAKVLRPLCWYSQAQYPHPGSTCYEEAHLFRLPTDDSLIVVGCQINSDRFLLALDTGASHTVIDITAIFIAGYVLEDAIATIQLSTANGVVEAWIFKVKRFSSLGIQLENFSICAYDFMGSNILAEFDGVLGLDFFKNTDLSISFKRFEITIE